MNRSVKSASIGMNPRLRSKYQQTSNQDYGWYCDPLMPKNELQHFGSKATAITGYMEHYVGLKGINPFNVKVFRER